MTQGKQQAYAQGLPKYGAPSDPRAYASTMTELTARPAKYNHENMVVFVMADKQLYYLKDGLDGSDAAHWTKIESNVLRFAPWIAGTYELGAGVSVGTTFYIAKQTTTSSPTNEPTHWLQLGTTEYVEIPVTAEDTKIIDHTLSVPHVTIVDATGYEVEADVQHTAVGQVTVLFSIPFTGSIRLK